MRLTVGRAVNQKILHRMEVLGQLGYRGVLTTRVASLIVSQSQKGSLKTGRDGHEHSRSRRDSPRASACSAQCRWCLRQTGDNYVTSSGVIKRSLNQKKRTGLRVAKHTIILPFGDGRHGHAAFEDATAGSKDH